MVMLCFARITQTATLLLVIHLPTPMIAFQLIPECEFPNKHSLTLYAPSLFPKHPLSNSRIPTLSSAYSRITKSIRNCCAFCEIEKPISILDLGCSSCTIFQSWITKLQGYHSIRKRHLIPYAEHHYSRKNSWRCQQILF